ncbi:MAG: superoxide dismutase family protein [Phycisphaerae bacterium]
MNIGRKIVLLGFAMAMVTIVGCARQSVTEAVAVVHPTQGSQCHGTVRFTKVSSGVRIVADIEGLQPNTRHAFHVHQYGDETATNGKSAGGHYNPEKMAHGRPTDAIRHAGDFGNIKADVGGEAHYERVDTRISIAGGRNPILGRAVIIHAGEDKFVQPTGGAGARVGIGIIGIAKAGTP